MARTPLLVFLYGSLIAFVWEIYQTPLFVVQNLDVQQQTIRCGIASLGDGLILLVGYGLASLVGRRDWPWRPGAKPYLLYFGFGLVTAVLVEVIATSLPVSSFHSWRYSGSMPMLPGTGLALVPIGMWIVVPALTLGLLRLGSSAER